MAYKLKWYPFSEHPMSDSCWSLSAGPDGKIYVAACCEHTPGETVKVYRYDEEKDALGHLFDLDEIVDDPRDSGRATQCKIHYSFAPSGSDGIMYMATHLSGPPIDLPVYSPWKFWHDPERCFRGSALIAFDTRKDQVLWWDTLIPKEGCRCLTIDEERGVLYALGYPRDHLYVYNIKARKLRDLGRIGSINGQVLFLDSKHRVWTGNDYGRLVRYDPEKDRLEVSPHTLPHNPRFQTGWHSVFYDVAASPHGDCVYAASWIANPYLMRIFPDEGEWGRVESLGPLTQERDASHPKDTFTDHCGGLTFAGDDKLYFVASRWRDPDYNPLSEDHEEKEGVLWRFDTETLLKEEVAVLKRPDNLAQYVSRGAVDHNGDLFMGHVGPPTAGMFKIEMPPDRKKRDAHLPLRKWG